MSKGELARICKEEMRNGYKIEFNYKNHIWYSDRDDFIGSCIKHSHYAFDIVGLVGSCLLPDNVKPLICHLKHRGVCSISVY